MEAINASNVSSLIVVVASCFTMVWVRRVSSEHHHGLTTYLLSVSVWRDEFKRIKERGCVDM